MKAKHSIGMALLVSGLSALADSSYEVGQYSSRLATIGQNRDSINARADSATLISSREVMVQEQGVVAPAEPAVAGSQYNSRLAAIGYQGTQPVFEIAPFAALKECGPDCTGPCCAK